MFESVLTQEEAESLREQQKEVEAQNLGEGELAEMKKQLQMSYEQQLRQMSQMVKFLFTNSWRHY